MGQSVASRVLNCFLHTKDPECEAEASCQRLAMKDMVMLPKQSKEQPTLIGRECIVLPPNVIGLRETFL